MIKRHRRLLARLLGFQAPGAHRLRPQRHRRAEHGDQGDPARGDHAITSVLEHNSVSRPLNQLENDGVITLTRAGATSSHLISRVTR